MVAQAIDKQTKKKVAIKRFSDVFVTHTHAKRILREITLIRLLKDPNLISIKEMLPIKDKENFKDLYMVIY